DGCGGQIDCGPLCPGDGGALCFQEKCCYPKSCGPENCGAMSDGCGTMLQCGSCTTAGETCGGGGTTNVCGVCVPKTMCPTGWVCGTAPTGCGGPAINCGSCDPATEICTTTHTCCTKTTCAAEGKSCGTLSDGCGGQLVCGNGGMCPDPTREVCLSNGTCCTPITCSNRCGYSGPDGCGGTATCPGCPPP
ncbi:MAG TPA: hypothetical protein VK550_29900, partial [Polyangiaceae bacterium]|nr:hypothetical protein [Polyangiaceae bacterium]